MLRKVPKGEWRCEVCGPAGAALIGYQFTKRFIKYGLFVAQIVHFNVETNKYYARYDDDVNTTESYTLEQLHALNVSKPTAGERIVVAPN